ncbi:MAG: asparaginase domain-containing protein, partial [Mariprofundus sp.]|nr:asparaginase domain-containing protein [Mariprofundus sp.]
MKILVMFTGGTIGSRKSGAVIDIDAVMPFHLLESYLAQPQAKAVEFDTNQPIFLLSENLSPDDWYLLLDALKAIDQSAYDGIIIAHGTDTLPYTSAVVSFGVQQCDIPIMFVSSDYPLDDERANGLVNFSHAVDFIADAVAPGIFVVFKNSDGESKVHLGSRLREADPYSDDFDSVNGVNFGTMKEGSFVYNDDARNISAVTLKQYDFSQRTGVLFGSDVLYIQPFVGLNYEYFRFDLKKPKAVLHGLYHSGTGNSSDRQKHSIKTFLAYCESYGVAVYAAP